MMAALQAHNTAADSLEQPPRTSCFPDGDRLIAPGEDVLLLAVDLPIASRSRRAEALPFAIEDRIAQPLDAVHVAIGPELAPRRYLAAVVAHDRMREWIARAEAEGHGGLPIIPEPLMLPIPPEGHWSVDLHGGRAVVRSDDGAGFTAQIALLPLAWEAAGRPACIAYGEPLPDIFPVSAVTGLDAGHRGASFDLRQGRHARRASMSVLWRRAAIVAGVGLAAHGAIAVADTVALRSIAADRRAETQALIATVAPGATGDDVAAIAADMLPANHGAPGAFLPLLARASAALGPLSSSVSVKALAFDGGLRIELEAADPAVLDNARRALARAGLPGRIEATPTQDGRARAAILVKDPAA